MCANAVKSLFVALVLVLAPGVSLPRASAAAVPDAPADLSYYEGFQGRTLHFVVVGSSVGPVWGTDIYTADSTVAAAAVHAGIVNPGEKKEVTILVMNGQSSYRGSTRNGVTANSYTDYRCSYRFLRPGEAEPGAASSQQAPPLEVSGNLATFRPRMGETLPFKVTGSENGLIYGTGIYTADSTLAMAAVHAGMVKTGETTILRVTILPGQPSYKGSEAHGVASRDWQEFSLSYRFEPKAAN